MKKLELTRSGSGNSHSDAQRKWEKEKARLKPLMSEKEYRRLLAAHKYQLTMTAGKQLWDELEGRSYQSKTGESLPGRNRIKHIKENRERMNAGN